MLTPRFLLLVYVVGPAKKCVIPKIALIKALLYKFWLINSIKPNSTMHGPAVTLKKNFLKKLKHETF